MRYAALFLSFLFHPIFLPTGGLIIIFSLNSYVAHSMPYQKQLYLVAWVFANTAIIPLMFTLFLRWKKMVGSIHLKTREDRILPFTFALFFYLTNYWLLRDLPLPTVIYSLFLGSSVAVGLALAFTFFTKVSIHMIGMGGLCAAVYGMARIFDLPILELITVIVICSGLVGTARFVLGSHNLRQIYLGWMIGFITVSVPLLRGWG